MKKTIVVLAVVLILFVLAGSTVLHLTGAVQKPRIAQQARWTADLSGGPPDTLKAIDLTGDGEDEVFVQTPAQVVVLSLQGEVLLEQDVANAKTTMGDLDGDGVDEFAVAEPLGGALRVRAYDARGAQLWESSVPDAGTPTRGLTLDLEGDGRREVVFGTEPGHLVCLRGATGELLWRYTFPADSPENLYVRGADDAARAGRAHLAAADYGGHVALLDEGGKPAWELDFPEPLRRLRTYDMDGDGTSEILLGGLNGLVWLASAADGGRLWESSIGSRVNEARFLELDGDPTRIEVVVGGQNGGIAAYRMSGEILWRRSVPGKVLELATLDLEGDGENELLVAAERVSLLDGQTGQPLAAFSVVGATVLDTGDLGKEGAYLAGTGEAVTAFAIRRAAPGWWSSPIVVGLVVSAVIAAAAVVLSRVDWTRRTVYHVRETSPQALRARKRVLREALNDLQRVQGAGSISAQDYLDQSRELWEQIAAVEEMLLKVQPGYQPEVVRCPACGAPLELGLERCRYCGNVLL